MKRILQLFFILTTGLWHTVNAQDCEAITGQGGYLTPLKNCAPVDVLLDANFSSDAPIDLNIIKILVDWGNGDTELLNVTEEYDAVKNKYFYFIKNKAYTYPKDGSECNYKVFARPVMNGVVCKRFFSSDVTVWDTDDANGGEIVITPQHYQACPGQEFSVQFEDKSIWNCTPASQETDKMNKYSRWTRFTYGASEAGISSTIQDVKVGGVVQSYPYQGAVKHHEYTGLNEILFPDHQALLVTVPATAQVGEMFQVKLENWNMCNPYDPNASEADNAAKAVVTYAYIEIVPKPEAEISAPADVCPNSLVEFSDTKSGTDMSYLWRIYDEDGTQIGGDHTGKKVKLPDGFATAGKKKITLLKKRKAPYDGSCFITVEKEITVSNSPSVDGYINGNAVDELKLCHDPVAFPAGQDVTYKFDLSSANKYEYELWLLKRNSSSDSLDASGNRVGSGLLQVTTINTPASVDHTSTYTKPGKYGVRVKVTDKTTGCHTERESFTIVYDKPKPDFEFSIGCFGEATTFTDKSSLGIKDHDDDIDSYAWDFGDTANPNGTTSTDQNPSHTFSKLGPFEVTLTVTTKGGCVSSVKKEVIVYAVPKATLSSTYTGPVCPGESIEFTNTSFAVNETTFGAGKVTYKLLYSDGTTTEEKDFIPGTDKRSLTFNNTTGNEITYEVKLKAISENGCEKISDPIQIKVIPGDKADFYEPNYSIFNANCSDIEFEFIVNDATLAIDGEKHRWEIHKNGQKVDEYLAKKVDNDPKYSKLLYTGINDTEVPMLLEVFLYVEKNGKCVQPAAHKYIIQPKPVKETLNPIIRQDCYYTYIDIKLNKTIGVKEYKWTISPDPENKASITYDDEFTLVYPRPVAAVNGGVAYPVTLSLEKENVLGCVQDGPSTKTINIAPKDIENVDLQLLSSTTDGCSPLKIDFKNATQVAAGSTFTYELYINNGSVEEKVDLSDPNFEDPDNNGLAGNFSYTFTQTGSYSVRLKAIGTDCELYSPATVFFIVYPDPKTDFDLDKKEGCAVLTSTIIKNNIVGNAINRWIVTDVSPGAAANTVILDTTDPTISYIEFPNNELTPKEYEVKLIAESANGCTAESVQKVKVFPAGAATFTVTEPEVCAPFEVEVSNTSLAGNPAGTTYTWNWGDGTSTSSTEAEQVLTHTYANPSYSVAQFKYITLTVTTPDGCKTTSAPVEVKLRPQVKAAFTASATIGCSPFQLYLQDNSLGASTHHWEIREKGTTGPALYTSNASMPDDVPELLNDGSAAKVYEVSLSISGAEGCTSAQTVEVSVLPGAKADFSADYTSALCNGESTVTFTNLNIKPGVEYTWNWGDGEPNEVTTTETSISHTFINNSTNRAKQFEITLTARNVGSNCSNQLKKTIMVNPMVEAMVVPDKKKGCAPLEVNFTNQSRNVATHEWFVRQVGSTAQEQLQSSEEAGFVLENHTGSVLQYEVVYTGTSSTGCKDTEVHLVEVYPMPEPDFTTDSVRVRLPNSTFKIENRTPNKNSWSYHWDFGDGTTSDAVDPVSHTYDTYGKYTIVLTISNGVCSESFGQEVTVNEILPVVDFESIPVSGCWPLVVKFENYSKYADPNKFFWDFGDGEGYATAASPSYTFHKPGEYTVTLTATNAEGEVSIARHSIVTVYERPRLDFELRENVVFVPGDPVYVANHTKGASSYLWDFGDGTTYTDFEPVHYYQEPGIYTITLIASNEWGCADTLVMEEVVTAKAGGKAKIPNAFTPSAGGSNGGDISVGNNDVFFPVLEGGVTRYNLQIYNRWGELLFETNKREIGWDGYYKGHLCKADVYVYKLAVEFSDGKKMEELGDVTLIR